MTETPEPTDKDLDTLADKLYERIRIKQNKEEKDQNEEKKRGASDTQPYAICAGCSRILTRSQYENSSCPHCGGTKAIIINHTNYTTN